MSVCCSLFGHWLPESGALVVTVLHIGISVTVLCAYNYFVCRLKLVFFCILRKQSGYGLFFLLQEHDGHFLSNMCVLWTLLPQRVEVGGGKISFSLYLGGTWMAAGLC